MKSFLRERPWIWVVVAFLVLFSAWTAFFMIALKNQPERVPLVETQNPDSPTPHHE